MPGFEETIEEEAAVDWGGWTLRLVAVLVLMSGAGLRRRVVWVLLLDGGYFCAECEVEDAVASVAAAEVVTEPGGGWSLL